MLPRAGTALEGALDFFGGVRRGVLNTFNFTGRARRMEYWSHRVFIYGAMIMSILVIGQVERSLGNPAIFEGFAYLALTVALVLAAISLFSVSVRRLHDHDMSGFMLLLGLIPLAGFYLLYKNLRRGTKGANKYGPDTLPPSELETSVF